MNNLAPSLDKLLNLKELWLHINNIGVAGALNLANVLKSLTNLEKLGLDNNSIENKGAIEVCTSLKDHKNIKMIGLGFNLLTFEISSDLALLLKNLNLDKLVLSGNKFNESDCVIIKEHLPNAALVL